MRDSIYIFVLLTLLTLSCKTELSRGMLPKIGTASMDFNKDRIFVGERIRQIIVNTTGFEHVSHLQLLVSNKWGIKVLEAELENDQALFDLKRIRFEERGQVEFIVTGETQILDRLKLNVLPLRGDSLIKSHIGPKTIIVGNRERSMLTNVVIDKYGNPILEGSTVKYNMRYPEENAVSQEIKTDHLISYIQFNSKEVAGKIIIGANSDNASIREQEVRVVPGYLEHISIEIVEWFPYADSRQTAWLRSDVMKDKYANVVADGTSIYFIVEGTNGSIDEYKSYTIGGIANVYIENPQRETTWKVHAELDSKTKSNVISMNFKSNIDSIVFDYDRRNHLVSVGPITSGLGQFVNDGTEVRLTISKNNEELKLENEALDGFCEFKLGGKRFIEGTYALALEVGGERSSQKLVIR